MSHADILEAAADLLFVHGRCTGHAQENGRLCVRGAINRAAGGSGQDVWINFAGKDTDRVLERWLALHPEVLPPGGAESDWVAEGYYPSWVFNDCTRGPEGDAHVIDVLRLCAKDMR